MELLVCQHDTTRLSSDARDYLLSLLGKYEGNAATSNSSYHGDDNEDDDDLNDDDDGDDDGYDDDDDCSVFEAASRISPVQEDTSDDHYGPYWDNSPTCTPYLVMCQTNCQKFSILLLFSKKILPVLLGFLCLAGDWDGS